MSGASAHKSRTQRQARRLAADLAKGKMPASTVDLEDYLDRFPDDVFVALDGFVEQVASSGADDAIALGYLYLIQGQLERVRFRSERGYEDATRLIEEFQRAVADLAVTGRIDAQALSMVTSVLHMAGIKASAELQAGVTQFAENVLPLAVPPDFTDAMADMVAECEGDPFQLAGALAEAGHAIPAEARILMAVEQIRSTNAALREAAILYLLDGEPTLRRAVASELQASQARAASLSPESLRRLIGMRNWCPEKERPAVDAIIRAVRAKGIDCAAWPQGGAGTIHASGIDGSGAQGFLIVSPVGQKVQISSVLLKSGVRDAWSAPPASKREVQSTLALAATETSMRPVSRKYFDRILRHHLQVGLSAGTLPPAELPSGRGDHWPCRLAAGASGLALRPRCHACGTSGRHADAAGRERFAPYKRRLGRLRRDRAKLVRRRRTCGTRRRGHRWSSGRAVGRPRAGRDPRTTTREMGGVLFRDGTAAARGTRRLSLARIRNPCAGARERSRPCRHIGDAGHCGKNCRGSFECTSIED